MATRQIMLWAMDVSGQVMLTPPFLSSSSLNTARCLKTQSGGIERRGDHHVASVRPKPGVLHRNPGVLHRGGHLLKSAIRQVLKTSNMHGQTTTLTMIYINAMIMHACLKPCKRTELGHGWRGVKLRSHAKLD